MEFKIIENNGVKTAIVCMINNCLVHDSESALDLIVNAKYSTGCYNIAISKALICEDFFDLKTGLAGEVMQKCINYGARLAVYGDFSAYKSKALKDLIYECNNGNDFFFAENEDEAVTMLMRSIESR